MLYKIARIPKHNGKFRNIYIPKHEYKTELRGLIGELEDILSSLDTCRVNYAFQRGRNCVLSRPCKIHPSARANWKFRLVEFDRE